MTPLPELRADVEAFGHYLKGERGLSGNTHASYLFDLAKFAEWSEARDFAAYLNPTLGDLETWVRWLVTERKLAPASVGRHIASLRQFYTFLCLDERTKSTTADLIESPKLWQRIPKVLTPQQVDRLLLAPRPGDRHFLRDRALLEVLYATGARASETVGLTVKDLYLDEGFLAIDRGKGGKSRVVPLGRPAVAALRQMVASAPSNPDAWLFRGQRGNGQLTRITLYYLVRDYCRRSGLGRKIGPHRLRHSFATALWAAGCDIRCLQEMLGHSSIVTTQRYAHVDIERLREIHAKLFGRMPKRRVGSAG